MTKLENLINYGISQDLAAKAVERNLSVTQIRALTRENLIEKFQFSKQEADALATGVRREPVDDDIVYFLQKNSNSTCCACKGEKGRTFILHHIVPYATSQNNGYDNLVVLCPTCHDIAHRPSGLTLGYNAEQLKRLKTDWELTVALKNSHRAALNYEVTPLGVDYVNIIRIDQACRDVFGTVPTTSATEALQRQGVLREDGEFNYENVVNRISGGRYLFDFGGIASSPHWVELVKLLGDRIQLADMNEAAREGQAKLHQLVGRLVAFTASATGRPVTVPMPAEPEPIEMECELEKTVVRFAVDPRFLLSRTAMHRLTETSRYAVYAFVRTVEFEAQKGRTCVKVIPLLLALPSGMNGMSNELFIAHSTDELALQTQ
jgi:5-methylcytosine-specific restriction endonuclease McrA